MRIAVIPARGSSKRIPRKNIRDFCGKPIIAWSIEAAHSSGLFEHVVVSTDDEEISAFAQRCGAEVPFVRPANLSDDLAGTTEVIAHATRWALDSGWGVSAVCCIYATAPFVQPRDLKRGLEGLESGDWDFTLAATEYRSSILRAFRRLPGGGLEMFFPEHFRARSQDLPPALHDAAQFYWGRPDAWTESRTIFGRRSMPILLPHWRVQDIDTDDDWRRAELLWRLIAEQTPTE